MPVSNKKQKCEQRKRIKLFDDFLVRAYRFDFDLKGESWFADDAAGCAHPRRLRQWWDNLVSFGPSYGYFVNGLIVKEAHLEAGRAAFNGTEVQKTTVGQRHLGAPLGSTNFVEQYVQAKVAKWVDQLDRLSVIAQSDPQAAYSAYVHGFQNSWIYLARCVPGIGDLLKPLEEVLEKCFIPALTSHNPNEATRDLLALPVRLGGLGLANPAKVAESEFRDSSALSAKLTAALLTQLGDQSDLEAKHRPKGVLHQRKRKEQAVSAQDVFNRLSPELQRYVTIACEKGASSWLTALPLQDHGFSLSKGTFRDAIRLRYGWSLHNLPSECVCGKPFSADHALNCKIGGYPCIRHNQVRDLLASLMKEVCTDVRTEPELQPLTGRLRLKMQKIHRVNLVRLNLLKSRAIIERH